ncbi:MAG TPA: hypothetical protein QGF58_29270 [Myxococcota bacterium]|nr:hypothetical protein [Myxococcota bacterium]
MLHLTLSVALSADHYSPNDVAAASVTFARYSEALGPRSDELEEKMAVSAKAVKEVDLAVNLLGERGAPLSEWRAEVRKSYAHQALEAKSFSDWIQDASTAVFTQAMDLAIAELGLDVVECAARSGGIASITGPMAGGSSCEGEDHSAAIAAAMDANTQLNAVVDELLAEVWPALALPTGEAAALEWTGDDGSIRIGAVAQVLVGERLEALEAKLDADLGDLDREISAGDAEEALAEATKHRLAYEASLAEEGERLLSALEKGAIKGGFEVGLCANPPTLGGCAGKDRTKEFLSWARDDKKVIKALQ